MEAEEIGAPGVPTCRFNNSRKSPAASAIFYHIILPGVLQLSHCRYLRACQFSAIYSRCRAHAGYSIAVSCALRHTTFPLRNVSPTSDSRAYRFAGAPCRPSYLSPCVAISARARLDVSTPSELSREFSLPSSFEYTILPYTRYRI